MIILVIVLEGATHDDKDIRILWRSKQKTISIVFH
jgi:hypothetical protein